MPCPLLDHYATWTGRFGTVDLHVVRPRDAWFHFVRNQPTLVSPGMVDLLMPHGDVVVQAVPRGLALDQWYQPGRYIIRRTHALGDVLIIHAAVQGWLRMAEAAGVSLEVGFVANPPFLPLLRAQDCYRLGVHSVHDPITEPAQVLNLNGVLEVDHETHAPRQPRTWFAMRHLEETYPVTDSTVLVLPEWSIKVPEDGVLWARQRLQELGIPEKGQRPFPVVSVTYSTGGQGRKVKDGLTGRFAERLLQHLPAVRIIVPDRCSDAVPGPRLHTFQRSSVVQFAALLQEADVVACPHTGTLWLAHALSLPTLLWLGTHPVSVCCHLHPLWPRGVKAIALNDWIDCPPCMESPTRCGGRWSCLREVDEERFINESVDAVSDLLEDLPYANTFTTGAPRTSRQ